MTKDRKSEIALKLVFATATIVILAIINACDMSHTRCDDKELTQARSPDGQYRVVTYHRSCANNTGQYTWVNLVQGRESLFSKAESQPVLTLRGYHEISATWIGSDNIEITCEGLADQSAILTQRDSWKTVHIRYKLAN